MTIMVNYFKLGKFFKLLVFVASFQLVHFVSYAEIDETEIGGLYDRFKPEYKYLSPLMGLLALKSNVLANIRFHGNYGAEQKEFLCHRQISHPARGVAASSDRDCPHDYTTAIIQHLFPSPAGGLLAASGSNTDIFYHLDGAGIGRLLKALSLDSELVREKELSKALNFVIGGIRQQRLSAIGAAWKYLGNNTDNRAVVNKLVSYYKEMFLGAKKEAEQYPPHLIETALLALAVKKANHISDLAPLLLELKEFTQAYGQVASYNKELYENFKISLEAGVNVAFSKTLEATPESLIFHTLAFDKYDKLYPNMLGTVKAKYGEFEFSDCGESSVRNFFNIVLGDHKNRTFDTNYLTRVFPYADKKLVDFYQTIQNNYDKIINNNMRSLWAEVVSNRKGVLYQKGGVCDIAPNGPFNIIELIAKLLNDEGLNKIEDGESKLSYLFKSFSRPDFRLDWKLIKDQGDSQGRFIIIFEILVNDEPEFEWMFTHEHFQLRPINNIKIDWRKSNHNLLKILCESKVDSNLLNALLPFYLPKRWNEPVVEILRSLDAKQKSLLWASFLYGAELSGSEQKIDALNIAAVLKSTLFKEIAIKWIQAIPDDPALNQKLAIAYFNIQQVIKGFNLNQEKRLLEIFFKDFSSIRMDVFFSRNLVYEILAKNNLLDLAQPCELQGLIWWAAQNNDLEMFQFLLDRVPELVKQELAKYKTDSPLHIAVSQKCLKLVCLLLDVVPELAHGKDEDNGSTVLHMAAYDGDIELVEFLLARAPELVQGELAQDKRAKTPLSRAAQRGHLEIVRLLAQHMPRAELIALRDLREEAAEIVKVELERSNRLVDNKSDN